MKIELDDLNQTILIIPAKTGVIYTNQVGGTACFQPELEGFIVPIEYDIPLSDLDNSLTKKLYKIFTNGSGIIEKYEVLAINDLLSASPFTSYVEINLEKLDRSVESWIHVKVKGKLGEKLAKEFSTEAILTWPNSD